jgi:hypothetical protein
MKKLLLTITLGFLLGFSGFSQTSPAHGNCGTAASNTALGNGGCVTTNMTGSVNMSGLCVGGNNPSIYIPFTAGPCTEIDITPSDPTGDWGVRVMTTGCNQVASTLQCHSATKAGEKFTWDSTNGDGTNTLTSGTKYVLHIYGPSSGSVTVCVRHATEKADNECGGATGLGGGTQSFYNGGNCSYTGSLYDPTTTDPAPSTVCAGSLENTQWIEFAPAAGATSFQILGSDIWCTGGGCGWQFGIFSGSCASLTSEGCLGRQNGSCPGNGDSGPTNVAGGLASIAWSNVTSTSFTATFTPTAPATSFTGTERFYLVMDGNANADCNFDLTGVNITPLSIEGGTLKGVRRSGKNILSWSAIGSPEQSEFVLQRSVDGKNWIDLMYAPVKNTTDVVNYNYTDVSYSNNSTSYYRVVGDFIGQTKVITKTVAIGGKSNSDVVKIRIFDVFGKEYSENNLPIGMVIYVTEFEDGTFETRKEYNVKK